MPTIFECFTHRVLQNSTTIGEMKDSGNGSDFEWVPTPPVASPTKPEFDCGVKTTAVSLFVDGYPSSPEKGIEPYIFEMER